MEALVVVAGLGHLRHRMRRRGLVPAVHRAVCGRHQSLDAELVVHEREGRALLCGPVEGAPQDRQELPVVGDRERLPADVSEARREIGALHVRVVRERVHDRLRPLRGAVGGAHVEDELRRRVGLPRARALVGAGVGECASEHLDRRRRGLDGVIGPREKLRVADRREILPAAPELRQPEQVQVRLVADDHVLQVGHRGDDRRRPRGEVALVGCRVRRLRAPVRIDVEVDLDAGGRRLVHSGAQVTQ